MARTYKQLSIVSGKSISDIINMDIDTFNRLNTSDLRKVVGRLVSAGNKRLRRFEKAGESTPATRHVYKTGGAFSVKGKNLNQLRAEYLRAKGFLTSETGTRKGWERVKRDVIKGLARQGVEMTPDNFTKVWQAYEDLKEVSPEVANRELKYVVLQNIADRAIDSPDQSADKIAATIFENLASIYEERAKDGQYGSSVSDFFEI